MDLQALFPTSNTTFINYEPFKATAATLMAWTKASPVNLKILQLEKELKLLSIYLEIKNFSRKKGLRPRIFGKKWQMWSVGPPIAEAVDTEEADMEAVAVVAAMAMGVAVVVAGTEEVGTAAIQSTIMRPLRKNKTKPMIMGMGWVLMEITTITNQLWTSTKTPKMTNPQQMIRNKRKNQK